MAQYLLALYKADNVEPSPERTRQIWAGVNELGDKMTDAGVFVFKSGLQGGSQAATVVRQSGGDFLVTDANWPEKRPPAKGAYPLTDPFPQKYLYDRPEVAEGLGEYLRGLRRSIQ